VLPPARLVQDLLRFSFLVGGKSRVCFPSTSGGANTLTVTPDERGFYYRPALNNPLIFQGNDYLWLYALDHSANRCEPVGLLLETRPHVYEAFRHEAQFVFKCNDCTWDYDACTATVKPVLDDAYRLLLDNYETEYNILLPYDMPRVNVTAQLATIAEGINIEFKRIDRDDQADYVGSAGWALFWDDQSSIYQGKFAIPQFSQARDLVIFRYRQRGYKLSPIPNTSPQLYAITDRSRDGWEPIYPDGAAQGGNAVNIPSIDYVKTPSIAGFKPYKLTGNGGGTPFLRVAHLGDPKGPQYGLNNGAYGLYTYGAGEFLSLDCGQMPGDAGYDNSEWLEVTGADGYGANSAEACDGRGLTIREVVDETHDRRIFWRFGNFTFTRCFRLLDGLHNLLTQTVAPYGGLSLVPPLPDMLSEFLTADPNPATGDQGEANEIPRLLLSAGSDIRRFGATEAATRLLISLKQFLDDVCALYNCGWFIDPATGFFRLEHRVYLETQHGSGVELDLTAIPEGILPRVVTYRTAQLPRYEQLTIANANTEDIPQGDVTRGSYYAESNIDYGLDACVVTKQGSNRTTVSSVRLTGDVPAAILNGESLPDSALFVLAPSTDMRLPDANRRVAANRLQQRYWRYGRATFTATVEGPGPLTLPNTVTGILPITGVPLAVLSVRPEIEQPNLSVPYCSLREVGGKTKLTTNVGAGGQVGKAVLDLTTGETTFTAWLPAPAYVTPGPDLLSRDFNYVFTDKFN
jgi:hypothetical protein